MPGQSRPKITIIIPIYNAEQTLADCIKGVLRQDYSNFELLLVNDGSSDGSLKICKTFSESDPRVRVLSNTNQGANYSRKLGVEQSSGDYICFVDADDWLEENALNIFVKHIGYHDLLISKCPIEEDLSSNRYLSLMLDHKLPKELWGKLFKRRILDEGVMDLPREIIIGEDFIWNIRVAKNLHSVTTIRDSYYRHNYNNIGSLMHKFKKSLVNEELFYNTIEKSLHDMGKNPTEIEELMAVQKFDSFISIVRDFDSPDLKNPFLRKVSVPSKFLKKKVNIIIRLIMYLPFFKIKIFSMKKYLQLRRKM